MKKWAHTSLKLRGRMIFIGNQNFVCDESSGILRPEDSSTTMDEVLLKHPEILQTLQQHPNFAEVPVPVVAEPDPEPEKEPEPKSEEAEEPEEPKKPKRSRRTKGKRG